MTEHTHKQFDAEMEAIRSGVLTMGGIVETQLARAIVLLGGKEDCDAVLDAGRRRRADRSTRCRSTWTSNAARSSPSGSRRRSTCA